ncbi:MAG TPA: acyl-CoA thioesterase domain-containing protein [Acidimicrobiia bacterium]
MIRDLLDLRPLGGDRFDALVPHYDYRPNLFGGQVAGQALRAAATTVAADRAPHSFHSYFVRSGRLDVPLVMQVERVRDGRSFSVRGVEALQEGEVVLDMVASFHVTEAGPRSMQPMADVPPPEEGSPDEFHRVGAGSPTLDIRVVYEQDGPAQPPFGSMLRYWVRSTESWPDDPGLAAAYAAYVADMRTGTGTMGTGERPSAGFMMASLDHSLWFHDRFRPEAWLLLDLRHVERGGNRGIVLGTMHTQDRRHVVTFAQEMLVRERRADG